MGEHTSRRREVRDGAALRIAVAGGFVVAGACAYLLVAARDDGNRLQQAACALCGVQGGSASAGASPDAPPAPPTRTGLAVAAGSATPPARSHASAQPSKSTQPQPQSPSPSSPASSTVAGSATTSPVTVRFTVTSQWGSAYHAIVNVTNSGAPLTNWKLVFKVPGGNMNSTNGAVFVDSGGSVTATPEPWDPTTLDGGGHLALGFTLDGTPQAPADCAMNGTPCTVTYVPYNPS